MIKCRTDYWNCTTIANYIRGIKKPHALGLDEWNAWHENAKKTHPIRYWMAEELLDTLQDIAYWPADMYYTAKTYVRNRWVDKTHYINTGLKAGKYHEFDTKILYGLFNELIDFVEIELAHLSRVNKTKKYNFTNGRCAEAGLDHLDWGSKLIYDESHLINKKHKDYGKPTQQALDYQEIKKLYAWWKIDRPNRCEPSLLFPTDKKLSPKKLKERLEQINKIEAKYDKEDTRMLTRLIKIRHSLWT